MKNILLGAMMVCQVSTVAQVETINHRIKKDSLAQKGTLKIKSTPINEQSFLAQIEYDFTYKFLFRRRRLQGVEEQVLPVKYQTEEGYLELEQKGTFEDDQVILIHKGRVNSESLYDCHKVNIVPKKSEKWEGIVTYCPDIPGLGFSKMELLKKKIPFLKEHTFYSYYVE